MALFRRAGEAASASSLASIDASGESFSPLPHVVQFITDTQWPDGVEREPGTILLCSGDGRLRAWLNDKDAGMSAWVSAASLYSLWERVEAILAGEACEWRKTREAPRGRGGHR